MKKFKNKINILAIALVFFVSIILLVSLRGTSGNPTEEELNLERWKNSGVFELSPERGRFALTYSVVENGSVYFTENIARFADPDVGFHNGEYVSLFAPLLSFISIPGYLIGKYFNVSQVGAFFTVAVFAIANFILLRSIAIRLGAGTVASSLAGLSFIFATPAFAYAVNLYQHHVSTFLMLTGIYALLRFKNFLGPLIVFFIFAAAIPLDYPNVFFLAPIAIYAAYSLFSLKKVRQKIQIEIKPLYILSPLIMVIPIAFFLWFNSASYGNPFQLSGTVNNAEFSDETNITTLVQEEEEEIVEEYGQRSAVGFLKTRNILNGFYIHSISPDRGVLVYAPMVIFGILGIILSYRKKVRLYSILVSIVLLNVLVYSMWGDPWGGWAFGSRYLIPSYAILSIFLALLLTYWRKNVIFLLIFTVVFFYASAVNTLGAITTSALPPQVQVLSLEEITGTVQKYTFERNLDFLLTGNSKSFAYNTFFLNFISPFGFYIFLISSIWAVAGLLIAYIYINGRRQK